MAVVGTGEEHFAIAVRPERDDYLNALGATAIV
jgi:preprotein translocase subunit Sss1